MSYTKKKITLIFSLGQGQFGETGANTVTVTGLRISAKINKSGGPSMCECQLRVFGLTPTVYNALTSIYPITQGIQRNTVTVQAGDDENGLSVVFVGQITLAQIDLNSQPDSVFNVIAQTSLLQSVAPISPSSYPNGVSVSTAMQSLATAMSLQFENNGVDIILPKSYYPGTAWQQALAIVEDAGIKWNGGDNGVLAIWPKNGSRGNQTTIPVISYKTNMIGYPSYSNFGIGAKCQYNPNIQFGAQVQIESSLQVANLNGLWTVFSLVHTLESEMPDGQWMTEIQGYSATAVGG